MAGRSGEPVNQMTTAQLRWLHMAVYNPGEAILERNFIPAIMSEQ